jgi:hypothetical protein
VDFLASPSYLVFKDDKFGMSIVASQAIIVGEAADVDACMFLE